MPYLLTSWLPAWKKIEFSFPTLASMKCKHTLKLSLWSMEWNTMNKNAFQQDVCHPLQWPSGGGGVCPGACLLCWCLPRGVCPGGVCPVRGCLPSEGVSAQWGGVCPVRGVCPEGLHPPMDRILDTRLWKHYLSATTVADGKNQVISV